MDEAIIEQIMQLVKERLNSPEAIPVEASARHVHLSEQDAVTLFGMPPTKKRDLSQPGEYLCNERLRLIGPQGVIENVAILGPTRSRTQVEISLGDARLLGADAPVRRSGNIDGTPGIVLASSLGVVHLESGLIVAERHLHMTPQDAEQYSVSDGDKISIKVNGSRPVVFEQVLVRVSSKYRLAMHIDFDEANCIGWQDGVTGLIVHTPKACRENAPEQFSRLFEKNRQQSPETALGAIGNAAIKASLQEKKLITEADILAAAKNCVRELRLSPHTIITPLAIDCARSRKIIIHKEKRGVR
jgi:propanediol utilization protein